MQNPINLRCGKIYRGTPVLNYERGTVPLLQKCFVDFLLGDAAIFGGGLHGLFFVKTLFHIHINMFFDGELLPFGTALLF